MVKTSFNNWTGLYHQFNSLEVMKSVTTDGETEQTVILNLSNYSCNGQLKNSRLTFMGVRVLRLENLDWPSAMLVSVTDISKDQWEHVSYSVKEEENDIFSFYCKSFAFEEISG